MSKEGHIEIAEELPKPPVDPRTDCCFGAIPKNTAAVIDVTANPAK